jgi:hypothetical protein
MASLASTGVTVLDSWTEGKTNGRKRTVKRCQIVLSSMGGTTNTIPATAFGLSRIDRCSNLTLSTNASVRVASPSYDGSLILVVAAQETSSAPADISGTFYIEVAGPATL